MGKRREKLTREEWAEERRRAEETLRNLQERIDYHTAKLREIHGPDYQVPTLEERIAYHAAKAQEERDRKRGWFRGRQPSRPG